MTRHRLEEMHEEDRARDDKRRQMEREKERQKNRVIRRGIGQPLSRSVACKTWQFEPAKCVHPDDHLRQRAGRGHFWWTCLACGSRWERLEASADKAINQPEASSSSGQVASQVVTVKSTSTTACPQVLPAPRYRPDLSDLTCQEESTKPRKTIKDFLMAAQDQPPSKTQGPMPIVKDERSPSPRRRLTSGQRPSQERARQKTHPASPGPREQYEIHSSGEEDNPWDEVTVVTETLSP